MWVPLLALLMTHAALAEDDLLYGPDYNRGKLVEFQNETVAFFTSGKYAQVRLSGDTCEANIAETYKFAVVIEFYNGRTVPELVQLLKDRHNNTRARIVVPNRDQLFGNKDILCDIRKQIVCVPNDPKTDRGNGHCRHCNNLTADHRNISDFFHDKHNLVEACEVAKGILQVKDEPESDKKKKKKKKWRSAAGLFQSHPLLLLFVTSMTLVLYGVTSQ